MGFKVKLVRFWLFYVSFLLLLLSLVVVVFGCCCLFGCFVVVVVCFCWYSTPVYTCTHVLCSTIMFYVVDLTIVKLVFCESRPTTDERERGTGKRKKKKGKKEMMHIRILHGFIKNKHETIEPDKLSKK